MGARATTPLKQPVSHEGGFIYTYYYVIYSWTLTTRINIGFVLSQRSKYPKTPDYWCAVPATVNLDTFRRLTTFRSPPVDPVDLGLPHPKTLAASQGLPPAKIGLMAVWPSYAFTRCTRLGMALTPRLILIIEDSISCIRQG